MNSLVSASSWNRTRLWTLLHSGPAVYLWVRQRHL